MCLKQNIKQNPQTIVKMSNGSIFYTLPINHSLVLLNKDNQCRTIFCLMLRNQISKISQQ